MKKYAVWGMYFGIALAGIGGGVWYGVRYASSFAQAIESKERPAGISIVGNVWAESIITAKGNVLIWHTREETYLKGMLTRAAPCSDYKITATGIGSANQVNFDIESEDGDLMCPPSRKNPQAVYIASVATSTTLYQIRLNNIVVFEGRLRATSTPWSPRT